MRQIKGESPTVAVLMLASKQQPYDNQKGLSARADDFIEKPFDTQLLIDKVKKLAARLPAAEPAQARPLPVGPTTQPGLAGPRTAPMGAPPGRPMPAPSGLSPRPPAVNAAPSAAVPVGRGTLAYGGYAAQTNSSPSPATPPAGSPLVGSLARSASGAQGALPTGTGAQPPPAAPQPAPPSVLASVATAAVANGPLANQLADLGLTAAQVAAVLALSRDVVEKVVWEVVPVLAETMIKEEIRRLTSA